MKRLMTLSLALCALGLAGCTTFYRVTDTDTGRTYLTTSDSFKQQGSNRVATFKDNVTGSTVTLTSYEYRNMTEDEFKADLAARQAREPVSPK